ncbi:MAG: class I SAM-dependent methyltransferase [Bacteroidetes bacterium]|nr:class I SAM-dependent methyltransferase [Bacteroidota bacterium]
MLSGLIKRWKARRLARQLRQPTGEAGIRTGEMMNKANATLYDFTLKCIGLQGNEQVLEIGFGNGLLFSKIMQAAPEVQVTGLDFSDDMVEIAHEHNREFIQQGRLFLQKGSSAAMPFADASFDIIYCINVVYFWDEPAAHLKEVLRVLKPGGRFYATIRTRESLEKMPFSNYGFTRWTEQEWQQVTTANGFHWSGAYPYAEQAVVFKGEPVQLTSVCMVVHKP